MVIRKIFTKGMVKHWHRQPRKVIESPTVEMFKKHLDVTLKDLVSGDGLK